ncbi:hypothetical protein LCGC14_0683790 [marine sediment metagenome]|uniref:Uncharacterized protein n=1 Tax=marine sediment metagenome TaxID=412755 RepID=A0A0F9TVK9_9ZZZZ
MSTITQEHALELFLANKASQKKYSATAKGKEALARYFQSDQGKAALKVSQAQYHQRTKIYKGTAEAARAELTRRGIEMPEMGHNE